MEIKKVETNDGTVVHYINLDGRNKFHNWDGPAYIPQGNKKLAEYYVYGIKKTKEEWEFYKKDGEGLPFYKTAAGKAMGARA
jgi:hypothetical protein